jgi:hypothetical protein
VTTNGGYLRTHIFEWVFFNMVVTAVVISGMLEKV